MSVSIKYRINEDVIHVDDVRGGITVIINGEPVPALVHEDDFESNLDWKPTYLGEYIHADINGLVNISTSLVNTEFELYEVKKITFPPSRAYFLVEPLSAEKIRIAHRIRQSDALNNADKPLVSDPQSACGYVVDRCEFCRSVSGAAHDYIADLRSMPLEWGFDLLEELEDAVNELDAALANCE